MKTLIVLMLGAITCAYAQQDRDLTGYTLVFSDEFNTLSVGHHENKGDATWSAGAPYGPASSFSASHWGIWGERWQVWTVSNGVLSLHTRYDPSTPNKWVSGIIASRDRRNQGFAQRFGYWSAKIKWPNAGQGAWSAFWLASTAGIPHGGGTGYEIDIMEGYGGIMLPGNPPTYTQGPFYDFLVHAWGPTGHNDASSGGRGHIPVSDPVTNWHIYGVEVNPSEIIGYLDGAEVSRIPTDPAYIAQPLYIILNYALQNNRSGEPFQRRGPSAMQVDWVRAYSLPTLPSARQRKSRGSP
jgi:beta-glucanase (GH16 family)